MRRPLLGAVVVGTMSACPADPEPAGTEDGGGTATDDGTTTGTGVSVSDSSSGAVDDTAADSTGTTPTMVLARDITVDLVEANQGVAVDIARNGEWLGPADRQAPLMKDRIALVRAFWEIPGDWEPREIDAHLVLEHPDGTVDRRFDQKIVEGESFIGDLSRCFYWGIEAEFMQPGLSFRVELYEVDDALADTPEPDPLPTVPQSDDFELVGVENSFQVMKVVLVPFDYDDGASCVTEPDISEESMQIFQDLLYMQNPLDRLEFEIHDKLTFTGEASNFGELNQILVDLRFEEGALPETYYYGLIDVCSGGLDGAGGQANGIPSDPVNPDNAFQRVSSGLSLDVSFSSETIVHEIGHSQGRRHVACNGEEGGPDPSYPHAGGDVNEWGFGVIDFQLRHPSVNKDYMTYCHPTWVGNWGWNKVYSVIRGLSEWDADFPGNGAPAADPYSGSILLGTVMPDGKERWSTVPGAVASSKLGTDTQIELTMEDGTKTILNASVEELPDAVGTLQIVAPLPATELAFGQVRAVARLSAGQRHPIAPASVGVHHHQRIPRR